LVAFTPDALAADTTPAASQQPLLTTRGLTKQFPGVTAVDHADLDLRAGEVVALLGPNGAGKSTFILMLSGVHPAGSYEGEISLEGQPYRPAGVADAEREGVVLIPQEVNVVPDRTVGQNMFLNNEPTRFGLIDWPGLYAAATAELRAFGVDVPVEARMGSLDLATQQLVIIARALAKRARILILDEPTAALTESEASRLFERLRQLRRRGVAIIFVSHRLSEVFAIAERILVMRDGRIAGDHRVASVSREQVVREMVGALSGIVPRVTRQIGGAALEVEHLAVRDPEQRHRVHVDDVGLTVHAGEIVGLFGLVGAGASVVAQAVFGAWTGSIEGSVRLFGRELPTGDPVASVEAGMGMMSQDRRETLVADHSVADNIVMASLRSIAPRGFLDVERKRVVARGQVASLRIRARSIDDRVGSLSGGNQQKVQVARWLTAGARVLLLDDPTRGVDVGARAEIHSLLMQLVADGCAVLWVSSDAEELFEVCDRVLVMRQGRIVAELPGDEATEERLLSAAAGV
jgi:D-xylose transport system ATP-binding protein